MWPHLYWSAILFWPFHQTSDSYPDILLSIGPTRQEQLLTFLWAQLRAILTTTWCKNDDFKMTILNVKISNKWYLFNMKIIHLGIKYTRMHTVQYQFIIFVNNTVHSERCWRVSINLLPVDGIRVGNTVSNMMPKSCQQNVT